MSPGKLRYIRDLEDDRYSDDKENLGPPCLRLKEQDTSRSSKPTPLTEIDISSFRRPDMNSDSLFDPLLLAAFEQAVKDHVELRKSAEKVQYFEERVEEKEVEQQEDEELPWKVLEVFEEKCPPGGNGSV
ncbi:hypothetical protein K1719_020182 [Acacia pycnantha]|nr:hypothetical protein K1719_020182 [Acacia pycnantha]